MDDLPQSSKYKDDKEEKEENAKENKKEDAIYFNIENDKADNIEEFTVDEVYLEIKPGNVNKVDKNKTRAWSSNLYGYFGKKNRQELWVHYFGLSKHETDQTPLEYDGSHNCFVMIVFYLLSFLIVLSSAMLYYLNQNKDSKTHVFFQGTGGFVLAVFSLLALIGTNLAMAYVPMLRMLPINISILLISYVFHNVVCARITAFYQTQLLLCVYMAVGTAVLFKAFLAVFPVNFRRMYPYLYDFVWLILSTVLFAKGYEEYSGEDFIRFTPLWTFAVMPLLLLFCINMELQALLSGRVVELGKRDYTLATYYCFTSYIDIFIKFMQLINSVYE